jgi:hypothetical protein
MLDLDERLAKMDAQGVDVQLVSTSPAHYHSWAPSDIAGRLARRSRPSASGPTDWWDSATRHSSTQAWPRPRSPRLSRFFMSSVAGQPVENALAITQLVLSGLLERRPGLRILIAHGGGYLPFHPGRMDHAWEVRPDLTTTERPSESLRRLYYDSLVYEPELLGLDRVVDGLARGARAHHQDRARRRRRPRP